MNVKDKFGILKHTRELIEKHLQLDPERTPMVFGEIPHSCKGCTDQTDHIKKGYEAAEKSMIDFIRTKSKPITDVDGVLELFAVSCRAFAILGHRYDLLIKKIKGNVRADDVRLSEAVRECVDYSGSNLGITLSDMDCSGFDGIGGIGGMGISFDKIDSMVESAYCNEFNYTSDANALLAVYLLNHFQKTGQSPDLCYLSNYLYPFSCADELIGREWNGRSIIGFCSEDEEEFPPVGFQSKLNLDFTKIFTEKLDILFAKSDDFAADSLKELLYCMAVQTYFGSLREGNVHRLYAVIDEIIGLHTAGKAITEEHTNHRGYRNYIGGSALLLTKKDIKSGTTYELNTAGLTQFVELIEALGLEAQPGFRAIAGKMKSL